MRLAATLLLGLSLVSHALALPGDPSPIHGQIQIQNLSPGFMQILQSSPQAILNWNSFNIGNGETVQFLQPGAQAAILNRVTGLDPSLIQGQLQANGRVFLLNPNGILFGPNSVVDVGSFTASTLKMSDEDFLSGNYRLIQDGSTPLAALTNQGQIRVTEGGFVVLVSPLLDNQGSIVAQAGSVQLGASTRATFSVDPRGQVAFVLPDGFDPSFSGGGKGGTVLLQPGQMTQLLGQVVSNPYLSEASGFQELPSGQQLLAGGEGILINSGSIRAENIRLDSSQTTVHATGGQLQGQDVRVLSAGNTLSQGSIRAGFAEVSGHQLWLTGPVVADTLLLDPDFLEITDTAPGTFDPGTGLPTGGSGSVSTAAITAASNLILNANFDITYDGVGFSGPTDLQLQAGRDIVLRSSGPISLGSLSLQATRDVLLIGNSGFELTTTSGDLLVQAATGVVSLSGAGPLRLNSFGNLNMTGVNLVSTAAETELVGAGAVNLLAAGNIDFDTGRVEIRSSGDSTSLRAGTDILINSGGAFAVRGQGPAGQVTLDAGRDIVLATPVGFTINLESPEARLLAGRNFTYIGEQISNPGSIHVRTNTGDISFLSQPGSHTTVYADNVLNITSGQDVFGLADDRIEFIAGTTTADYLRLSAARNLDLRAFGGHVDVANLGGSTSITAQNIFVVANADSVYGSPTTTTVQATNGDLQIQVVGGRQEFNGRTIQVSATRDLVLATPLETSGLAGDVTALQAGRNVSVDGLSTAVLGHLSVAGGNISLESMDRISGGNFTFTTPGNLTERTPALNPPSPRRLEITAGRIFSPNNTADNLSFAIPNANVVVVNVTGSNDEALGAAASLRNFNGANVQPQTGPSTGDIYVDGTLVHRGPARPAPVPAAPNPASLVAGLGSEQRSQLAVQSNLSLGNLGSTSRVLSDEEAGRTTASSQALHSAWNSDPFSPTLALALPGGVPVVYAEELGELSAMLNQTAQKSEEERTQSSYNAIVDQELREIWEVRYWRHLVERMILWEDRE